MSNIKLFQVDAFTHDIFKGNPAGVCLTNEPLEESFMQKLANEMNLSETAFLWSENDGFRLRWFTPETEVSLCGHATLSSAHILYQTERLKKNQIAKFYTMSGVLTACYVDGKIELDFPTLPEKEVSDWKEIQTIISEKIMYIGKNDLDYLVELSTVDEVKNLTIDFEKLKNIKTRGLMVTAKSHEKNIDFVSRFFAPAIGVNEDPVTGSAHTCLAPYWSKKLGKTKLSAKQISKRGGELSLKVEGDRIKIAGNAVTVFEIELK